MRVPFNEPVGGSTITLPNGAVYRVTVMQTTEERAHTTGLVSARRVNTVALTRLPPRAARMSPLRIASLLGLVRCASALGPTFGTGLAGTPVCQTPLTILNYTLPAGETHAVLHHFWVTGQPFATDRLWVEYTLDGEAAPSIAFQPAMMCGCVGRRALPSQPARAGRRCVQDAATRGTRGEALPSGAPALRPATPLRTTPRPPHPGLLSQRK